MNVLLLPAPVFDEDIAVVAYCFRYCKGNCILEGSRETNALDGAMNSPMLQMLETVGLEALTMGKPVFVPIDKYMLLSGLERQCAGQPADKIIFLFDGGVPPEGEFISTVSALKEKGYRFAIHKIVNINLYEKMLELCDFIFYDHRIFDYAEQVRLRLNVEHRFRHIMPIYGHIDTTANFNSMKIKHKGLYEGPFYRVPLTRGEHKFSALQVNMVNLLNCVGNPNFEFRDIVVIIQKDPALTIDLLKIVNSAYFGFRNKIKSINQAVVMLGQDEVRKWITTAVAKMLGSERPSEITRLALVRAKFVEALAPKFGMDQSTQSVFLMGLFSVLDAMLELPMDEALKLVHVADDIYNALVDHSGDYAVIYDFMLMYEAARWNAVSRAMLINDITAEELYQAYVDAVSWYGEVLK